MSMGKKNRKSKTKSKRRKPKFSPKKSQPSDHMPVTSTASTHDHQNSQQLNLFPLHPENLVDDKDSGVGSKRLKMKEKVGWGESLKENLGIEKFPLHKEKEWGRRWLISEKKFQQYRTGPYRVRRKNMGGILLG